MGRLTNRKIGGERDFLLPENLKIRSLMYHKLAEYEDLDENGRLMILPESYSRAGSTDSQSDLIHDVMTENLLAAATPEVIK